MSYVDPTDAVPNTIALAADFNILAADIRDLNSRLLGVSFQGVGLKKTANQSIGSTEWQHVTWGSDPIDIGGWWTSGSSIIVPALAIPSGFTKIAIHVEALLNFSANNAGIRNGRVTLNGTEVDGSTHPVTAINGDTTVVTVLALFEAEAGDVIRVQGYQSSGSTINITSSSRANIERRGGSS